MNEAVSAQSGLPLHSVIPALEASRPGDPKILASGIHYTLDLRFELPDLSGLVIPPQGLFHPSSQDLK